MSDAADHIGAVQSATLAAHLLAQWPLHEILSAIDRAEAIGPFLDPTLYVKKCGAMREDKALLEAALPLWEFGRRHAIVKAEAGGERDAR